MAQIQANITITVGDDIVFDGFLTPADINMLLVMAKLADLSPK